MAALFASPLTSDAVDFDFSLIPLRRYKDGHLDRLDGDEFIPPSNPDPTTNVSSKDVLIQPVTGVSARLYLPPSITTNLDNKDKKQNQKLPVIVYYHGGGFCIGSPFSPLYHSYVTSLVSKANVMAVSVHYRRATEHPLPAAYNDSWMALKWVASHATGTGPDPWLNDHADFNHVFLAGDSAGGNIAHNIAMRAREMEGMELEGVVLVHPYFCGENSMEEGYGADPVSLEETDMMWRMVCPGAVRGNDDPWIKPWVDGTEEMKVLACRRVLVCLAERDALCGRGRRYATELQRCGWEGEVEVLQSAGKGHVFHLFDPDCRAAGSLMKRMVSFFHGD